MGEPIQVKQPDQWGSPLTIWYDRLIKDIVVKPKRQQIEVVYIDDESVLVSVTNE